MRVSSKLRQSLLKVSSLTERCSRPRPALLRRLHKEHTAAVAVATEQCLLSHCISVTVDIFMHRCVIGSDLTGKYARGQKYAVFKL